MPWQTEGDNVNFSGALADLMAVIMTAYDQDAEAGTCDVTPGTYVTATAIVLREIVLESLAEEPDASEFLERVSASLHEDEDGNVEIATFALLDDVAEHISAEGLDMWLGSPEVRSAIVDLAMTAFPA